MTRPTLSRPLRLIENDGWPNTNKALVLRRTKKNTRDPSGYYATLGVPPWATQEEIREAYRALVKLVHPDLNPEVDPDLFLLLQEIYETLSDPKKREIYNRTPEGFEYIPDSRRSEVFVMSERGEISTTDLPQDILDEINWTPPEVFSWDYYLESDGSYLRESQAWYELLCRYAWDVFSLAVELRLGLSDKLERWPYIRVLKLSGRTVLVLSIQLEINRENAILALFYLKSYLVSQSRISYTTTDDAIRQSSPIPRRELTCPTLPVSES